MACNQPILEDEAARATYHIHRKCMKSKWGMRICDRCKTEGRYWYFVSKNMIICKNCYPEWQKESEQKTGDEVI